MPNRHVVLHRLAERDVDETFDWYFERSPEAARNFLHELYSAIEKIADAPLRWPIYHLDTRRLLIEHFPFMVIYRERRSVIQVLAVAHCRRKPGFWLSRRNAK